MLGAFITIKARDDVLTLAVSLGVAALITISQIIVAQQARHTDQDA
ncbi:hypothetical protein BH11ACT8_BH11ACT8_05170 [soil metagenome]